MCCYLFCDFKNERETGPSTCCVRVRKDLWDRYWRRALSYMPILITVPEEPEVFAKVNPAQF